MFSNNLRVSIMSKYKHLLSELHEMLLKWKLLLHCEEELFKRDKKPSSTNQILFFMYSLINKLLTPFSLESPIEYSKMTMMRVLTRSFFIKYSSRNIQADQLHWLLLKKKKKKEEKRALEWVSYSLPLTSLFVIK